jgi:putative transposase
MLEGEMAGYLGYELEEAAGRNSGNNRNGHYAKKMRTSTGETTVQVPRHRNGEFEPQIIARYAGKTNELEENILMNCPLRTKRRFFKLRCTEDMSPNTKGELFNS